MKNNQPRACANVPNCLRAQKQTLILSFEADEKTVFAVIRALEIIGEAAKKVPSSLRKRYPDIPCRQVAGMRDKVNHDYSGVNVRRVFETVLEVSPTSCAPVLR